MCRIHFDIEMSSTPYICSVQDGCLPAPYFGNQIFVWRALIAVFTAALAVC
jgi:hypothetical protein